MRIDPPKSVPMPSTLPLALTREASPPELPPEINRRLSGFTHCPNTWLYESDIIIDCGRLVFTYSTAPRRRKVVTTLLSELAGWLVSPTQPEMSVWSAVWFLTDSRVGSRGYPGKDSSYRLMYRRL